MNYYLGKKSEKEAIIVLQIK